MEIEIYNDNEPDGSKPKLSPENLRYFLEKFVLHYTLEPQKVASKLGWSVSVWNRLISGKTCPTERSMKECALMFYLGFDEYSRLSKKKVESITEKMGGVASASFGTIAVKAIIGSLGASSGLSAAGIMSGLRVLGTLVGGGAAAGISVAATIPVAAGAAGWGIIKLLKLGVSKMDRFKNRLDERFEREW
ncbi:hypothetical protein [uncultured Fibrobacter sp.]|uniref:hypothetical protein n=1 Tax=uncultured Fibrobacter sp. TaxID=261512 RepID=UPI0025E9021A|nr:hypothetical protein [uncultured Fibrobacter sp.]